MVKCTLPNLFLKGLTYVGYVYKVKAHIPSLLQDYVEDNEILCVAAVSLIVKVCGL